MPLIFVIVSFVTIQNVVISKSDKVLDVVLLNIEALANDENGGGEGWTSTEFSKSQKLNGVVVYESEGVSCEQGGPMSSCTASCKERRKNGDSWGEWMTCE